MENMRLLDIFINSIVIELTGVVEEPAAFARRLFYGLDFNRVPLLND